MEKLVPATRDCFHPGTIFRFRLYEEIVPAIQDYLHRPPRGSKLILAVKIEMATSNVFRRNMYLYYCNAPRFWLADMLPRFVEYACDCEQICRMRSASNLVPASRDYFQLAFI